MFKDSPYNVVTSKITCSSDSSLEVSKLKGIISKECPSTFRCLLRLSSQPLDKEWWKEWKRYSPSEWSNTHHRMTAKIIPSTTQSILVHILTQAVHINSTTSDLTDPDFPSTVYLTTLTANIIFIPFIIAFGLSQQRWVCNHVGFSHTLG